MTQATEPAEPYEAIEAACSSLRARARDTRLCVVPGLAGELLSIATALESSCHASRVLARVLLRKHFGYDLSPHDYATLVALARAEGSHADTEKCSDRQGGMPG